MDAVTDTSQTLLADYQSAKASLPGAGAAWLRDLREGAIARFEQAGFPSTRDEAWKYTNVGPYVRAGFRAVSSLECGAQGTSAKETSALKAQADRVLERLGLTSADTVLVFTGGRYLQAASRISDRPGVVLGSLRSALDTDDAGLSAAVGSAVGEMSGFAALNTAFLEDGALVDVAPNAAAGGTIHLVFLGAQASGALSQPRNLLRLGANSSASVMEHYTDHSGAEGAAGSTNAVTEVILGPNSSLNHVKVQTESSSSCHVGRIAVSQGAGSSFSSCSVALGAGLSRTEIAVHLHGEGAETRLSGLTLTDGKRVADHHVDIDHAVAHTVSDQVFRAVAADSSRGVFTGKVLVRQDAQQIRAAQANDNLLLGDQALVETRPQMEIYADDVRCNHGATVGRLNEDSLFYLRARGIDPVEAATMLTAGFCEEVLSGIVGDADRQAVATLVRDEVRRVQTESRS